MIKSSVKFNALNLYKMNMLPSKLNISYLYNVNQQLRPYHFRLAIDINDPSDIIRLSLWTWTNEHIGHVTKHVHKNILGSLKIYRTNYISSRVVLHASTSLMPRKAYNILNAYCWHLADKFRAWNTHFYEGGWHLW